MCNLKSTSHKTMSAVKKENAERVAQLVPLSDLCTLLEQLSKPGQTMQLRREKLRKFMDSWRTAHQKLHVNDGATTVEYLCE